MVRDGSTNREIAAALYLSVKAVESQLTISPWKRSARAMPSALLPVAVGPRIATSRGTSERGARARASQRESNQCGEDDEHSQQLHP